MTSPSSPTAAADGARADLVDALLAVGREDRSAFARLYRLTSAKLFGICLRICGERAAAEDVLSEVYLTVWRRAGAFEPGRASPITWLATIARNRAIDWVRAAPAGAARRSMRRWTFPTIVPIRKPRRSPPTVSISCAIASMNSTRAAATRSGPPSSTARPTPSWPSAPVFRLAR